MINRFLAYTALISLAACFGEPPALNGKVVDPWNKAVDGATVALVGKKAQAKSTKGGAFSIKNLEKGKYEIKAAKDGYIPDSFEVDFDPAKTEAVETVRLIPEPTSDGYHVVGAESYLKLAAQTVTRLGTELQAFQGIKSAGDVEVSGLSLIHISEPTRPY